MPAWVSPSTRPALSSIGVLAASIVCDQVLSPARFMRTPSAASEDHDIPLSFLKSRVRRTVPARRREAFSSTRPLMKGVRSSRCGIPSALVVTMVPSRPKDRYVCLISSGTALSLVSRKRVPMPIPAAPYDSAAASPRPSKNPPAATTGMSTASMTVGSCSVVGMLPV